MRNWLSLLGCDNLIKIKTKPSQQSEKQTLCNVDQYFSLLRNYLGNIREKVKSFEGMETCDITFQNDVSQFWRKFSAANSQPNSWPVLFNVYSSSNGKKIFDNFITFNIVMSMKIFGCMFSNISNCHCVFADIQKHLKGLKLSNVLLKRWTFFEKNSR